LDFLHELKPDYILLLMLCAAFSSLLLMARLFGRSGVYVFIIVAIIGANIQVLKAVQFSWMLQPVALGTILFASTYLATDILTECYGRAAANRGVWLGFAGYLLFVLFMMVNLAYAPLTPAQAAASGMEWNLPYHGYMEALFLPMPAFFAASMIAYLVSQLNDVWLYCWIRGKTGDKYLWLRNNASTIVSAAIDTVVFNVFAWVVFRAGPVDTHTLIYTYMLGTFALRVMVALLDTPFLYAAKALARRDI
jgi:queuosine precursor transporter